MTPHSFFVDLPLNWWLKVFLGREGAKAYTARGR